MAAQPANAVLLSYRGKYFRLYKIAADGFFVHLSFFFREVCGLRFLICWSKKKVNGKVSNESDRFETESKSLLAQIRPQLLALGSELYSTAVDTPCSCFDAFLVALSSKQIKK